jgi:hypothetical protein
MKDLMFVLSSVLTFEQIVEKLKEAVQEHSIIPNDKNRSSISFYCAMILSKDAVDAKGIDSVIKETDELERLKERLNTKDN